MLVLKLSMSDGVSGYLYISCKQLAGLNVTYPETRLQNILINHAMDWQLLLLLGLLFEIVRCEFSGLQERFNVWMRCH